jgi:hypothetical protein
MESLRHRLLALLLCAFAVSGAVAQQQDAERFPSAAMFFLDTELPAMERAVTEKDRDYFEDAMGRMLDFSDAWGFKTHANPALARFPMCTEAVSDFLVVGLCRFRLSAETCQPVLISNFNTNLARCRELAARN